MGQQSPKGLDRIIKRIDAIQQKRPSHKEVLEFLKGIVTEQYGAKERIRVEPVDMTDDVVKLKIREGFPLIDKKDLNLDMESGAALFKRLCAVVQERNSKAAEDVNRISEAVNEGRLDLEKLFGNLLAEDGKSFKASAGEMELNQDLLMFLAKNSVNPLLEAYADQLKGHIQQKKWWKAYCPICGSKPVMAALRKKEGERYLLCSCCGFEWRFSRMKCPFCGRQDRDKHRYFYIAKESRAYRVDVCDKCKKYIKTVDTTQTSGDIVLFVEDIGTLHFDLIAQKEGYKREVANILNV